MITKSIIFIIIACIIQIGSTNWMNILIYASILGIGSKSYNQSLYFGICIGLFPWLLQFIILYDKSNLLLHKISNMFGFNSPILLIIFSIIFITILCTMVSCSSFYIKNLIKNDKR